MKKLWGCKIFNGSAKDIIDFGYVAFEGNKIMDVQLLDGNAPVPVFSEEVIDARGCTVMPGLIDCEVHLMQDSAHGTVQRAKTNLFTFSMFTAFHNAQTLLRRGFTTVLDKGDKMYEAMIIRDAQKAGRIMAPRIFCCGRFILVTGGHAHGFEADGSVAARKAARMHLTKNVDWVKIVASSGSASELIPGCREVCYVQMMPDEIAAVVEVARTKGRRVAAHANDEQSIINCLDNGVTSISHGSVSTDRVIEAFLRNDGWLVPTFSPFYLMGKDPTTPKHMYDYTQSLLAIKNELFVNAVKAGVNIAYGTDCGAACVYMGDVCVELKCMIDAGMPLNMAMESVTSTAARSLECDDTIGWLKPGYLADILVVGGDPFEDLYALRDVRYVFQEGKKVVEDGKLVDVPLEPLYSPEFV